MPKTNVHTLESPIGMLGIQTRGNFLVSITFLEEDDSEINIPSENTILAKTKDQLGEYFTGVRRTFDLPLKPNGTDFQKSVWKQLANIPFGQTTTYGALAKALGDHKKVRAVGHANGQNPLPIIIPCHRVIGSDNKLIGYAGGIERKRWLLQHEGALLL